MDETDYKSSSKEKVPEKEWNDFLEKEIYDEGKGDQIDKNEETNGSVSLEDKTKSEEDENINQKEDPEYVRKRLATLGNQWNWYRNIIKDVTDGNLMLPKDLPDEEDEVSDVEKYIVNEYQPPRSQDDAVSIIEDNSEIEDEDESCMSSSSSFDENSQSEATPYQKARKYYMEIAPSQDSEKNTTQPDSQMSEVGTESLSSQMPEIVTDVLTSQPSESKIAAPSSQSLDDIQHEQPEKSTTYVDTSTDENEDEDDETFKCPETHEELQEQWRTFLSTYEQCTGKVPDLPEELPDEEDEISDVEKYIINEYPPPPPESSDESTESSDVSTQSSDESIVPQSEPVSLTQQEDAPSQQDKLEFTPDPGFAEYLQRQ